MGNCFSFHVVKHSACLQTALVFSNKAATPLGSYFALVAGSLLQPRLVHKLVRMCSTAHACMPGQFRRRCASEFGIRVQILVEAVLVPQRKPA